MRYSLAVTAALAAVLMGSTASADVLGLHAQIHAGGAHGAGVGGARADEAFHEGAAGGIYGFSLGAEFLLLDAWIDHNQYRGSSGLLGTWTQFMTGIDASFDLGEPVPASGAGGGSYAPWFAELGMGIGFGVGTGQQVDPPLDNSEVTDKGFMAQIHAGIGYRLSRTLSIGLAMPVQAGFLFKSGPGAAANDQGTQYQSIQAAALANVRIDLNL